MSMICFHAFSLSPQTDEGDLLILQVGYDKPLTNGNPFPKTPVVIPKVSLAGHSLYVSAGYALAVSLYDANGNEVYSTAIIAGTTTVFLPSTLNGDFRLVLHPGGDYYYYADITL